MYRCPKCNDADHIDIAATIWVRLIQPEDDPEAFETDHDLAADGDTEWDGNSGAVCAECGYGDNLDKFEVEAEEDEDEAEVPTNA